MVAPLAAEISREGITTGGRVSPRRGAAQRYGSCVRSRFACSFGALFLYTLLSCGEPFLSLTPFVCLGLVLGKVVVFTSPLFTVRHVYDMLTRSSPFHIIFRSRSKGSCFRPPRSSFEHTCSKAFSPIQLVKAASNLGLKKLLRVKAWMSNLYSELQRLSFNHLSKSACVFADNNVGAAFATLNTSGTCRHAILSVCHSYDEASQWVQVQQLAGARQPHSRVAVPTMTQSAQVQAVGVESPSVWSRNGVMWGRAEDWLMPPLELNGKKAEDFLGALKKVAVLDYTDVSKMTTLSKQWSFIILSVWSDEASSNDRLCRHLRRLVASQMPPNVLLDEDHGCFLHYLHNIKTSGLEGHNVVAICYCLSKLLRFGSVQRKIIEVISSCVENGFQFLEGESPPLDVQRQKHHAMDLVFDLDSPHHQRQSKVPGKRGHILQDVSAVLEMDTGPLQDTFCTHHCPCVNGKPHCKNKAEAILKTKRAYLNLLTTRSLPGGSLAKWTHAGEMMRLLSASYLLRGFMVLPVRFVLDPGSPRTDLRPQPFWQQHFSH